jgi:hypothetical protein
MSPADLAKERDADLAWVMSTSQGRRFLYRLAFDHDAGMLLANPYLPDSNGLPFNVGRQSLARWVLGEVERVNTALFEKMMVEAYDPARRPSRPHVPADADSSS